MQLNAAGSVVWALVASTRLFRSIDRGETWQERPLPPQPSNVLLALIDDHQGWIAMSGTPAAQCQTQAITLWHTFDAAATWQSFDAPGVAAAQCKTSFTFPDPMHGYLTASDPNSAPVIYRLLAGGSGMWQAAPPLALPPGFVTGPGGDALTPFAIRAFGPTILVAASSSNGVQYAYRSSDGGATWSYVGTVPTASGALVFVTAMRWLEIGAPVASKETTDGGVTWHAFASDYLQAAPIAPAIVFGDAQVGYATVRGAIQRTIDGGVHWTGIRTPGTF